jgi:hypothetical protein
MVAQGFSLIAVLVGIAAIAAGLGPHSAENDIYHWVMAPVLSLTLVWLATPSGGRVLGSLRRS